MRYTQALIPTLREKPSDAEIDSHILMVRAGLMRKSAAGLYSFLPLGFRALKKVERIIREEMDRAGALEVLPPMVTPAELWRESGRFDAMGPEMLKMKDRHGNDLVLAPTHEEAMTALIRENTTSYRDFPLNIYQINTKFRDEIRPRFGVMRSREFIMMDAYSFDVDQAGLDQSYDKMSEAYKAAFLRCGLEVDPVKADTGNMGGSDSEEFMVPSQVGEDEIVKCDQCGYVANTERATAFHDDQKSSQEQLALETVDTPRVKTIAELKKFFETGAENFIKSLIYLADEKPILALIRGDLEINEVKLKNALGAVELKMADDQTVYDTIKAPVGFIGPVDVKDLKIIADESVKTMVNAYTGANQKDKHYKNVNIDRDFSVTQFADLESVKAGALCPVCHAPLKTYRGIEVGHIFKLGYKYTKSMNVSFQNENGVDTHPIMGCYGIGVGRTLAAVIEQNHDDWGIIWPMSVAPYQVILVPVNVEDETLMAAAEKLYAELSNEFEVLLDDRNERAGVKFKDADLIGVPIRVTIGRSFSEEGKLELKERKKSKNETELVSLEEIREKINEIISREMAASRV